MASKHIIKLSEVMNFFKDEEKLVKRGENAVDSGHVISMMSDSELLIIRGKVHASMRDRQYNVEIEFDVDWSIKSGKCNCPHGQLRCHHMAALLLFARDNLSVTDKECAWSKSKPPKDIEIKKIKDIYPPKPHRATERNLTEKEINDFNTQLSVFDGAVGFSWLLADEIAADEEKYVANIEDILFSEQYLSAQDKSFFFQNKVKLEQLDILKLAEETIGQSNNSKWLMARKNRLTASNFSIVLAACHRERYPPSLFKRLSGAHNLDHIKAVQWGNLHEKQGVKALEEALDVKVIPTGIWLHQCGYLGASPDGLIGDHELIEVKCPFKYRDQSLLEAIKTVHDYIITSDNDGNISVNRNHEYFFQIQGQQAVTNRKKAHLVVWTPKEVVIVNIEAEDFEDNLKILKKNYLEHYIPFLLGEKYVSY